MYFKKGDKVICKRTDFLNGGKRSANLIIGKEYEVLDPPLHDYGNHVIRVNVMGDTGKVENHRSRMFYTKQEVRDMKLKQLLK